jgi:hypothetical protein
MGGLPSFIGNVIALASKSLMVALVSLFSFTNSSALRVSWLIITNTGISKLLGSMVIMRKLPKVSFLGWFWQLINNNKMSKSLYIEWF